MTSVPHPQADEGGRSQVFTLRERAAYPQLGCFPSFNEVDGPRHASYGTVFPSNLIRPLLPHCTTARKRPPAGLPARPVSPASINQYSAKAYKVSPTATSRFCRPSIAYV